MKKKELPKDLTSRDFIKTFAVVVMVVDHVGFYFFPENLWLRVIGRLCLPAWFFLAGYTSHGGVPKSWLACGLLLAGIHGVVGAPLFPLNILFTIALVRLTLEDLMEPVMKGRMSVWLPAAILFVLGFPTLFLTAYGTQGLVMAIFGYLVRHRQAVGREFHIFLYMLFALSSFTLSQMLVSGFTTAQTLVMAAGLLIVYIPLYRFRPGTHPALTSRLPGWLVATLRCTGRHTLAIYTVHLAIFCLLALLMGREGFAWFAPTLF